MILSLFRVMQATVFAVLTILMLTLLLFPEQGQSQSMSFEAYDPPSNLVVPQHRVTRAKFPFIDVHNHQWGMPTQNLSELTAAMDSLNMAVMVNLSGRGFNRLQNPDGSFRFGMNGPDFLKQAIDNAGANAPGRFVIFTNIDFNGILTITAAGTLSGKCMVSICRIRC